LPSGYPKATRLTFHVGWETFVAKAVVFFFFRDAHFSSVHMLKELLTFCTAIADVFAEYWQNTDYNAVVWEF